MKFFLGIVLFCAVASAGNIRTERPNYITDEEFAKIRGSTIIVSNTTVLPLPEFKEHIRPMPGIGPRLWTNAQVPYTLDPTFDEYQREQVALAIQAFHDATCIRFVPKQDSHTSWVDIEHDPNTCGVANVCMNEGGQFARFGGSCVNAGTMVHELGHTLCMGHEQTRRDRDEWIDFNRAICEPHGMDGPDFNRGLHKLYDYVSIEHYEGECYNGCFQPKQPGVTKCGSGGPLSVLDIEVLNEMYGCDSGCLGYRYVNSKYDLVNPVEAAIGYLGDVLYSCRVYHEGDIIPGVYYPSTRECLVGWGGLEHTKNGSRIEILTNPNGANFQWRSSSTLPANAVRGGRTNERETLYVIRCDFSVFGTVFQIPGKYEPSIGPSATFAGEQYLCGAFQFLTCG